MQTTKCFTSTLRQTVISAVKKNKGNKREIQIKQSALSKIWRIYSCNLAIQLNILNIPQHKTHKQNSNVTSTGFR